MRLNTARNAAGETARIKGYLHPEVGCEGFAAECKCLVLWGIWLKRQGKKNGLAIQIDGCNAAGNDHSDWTDFVRGRPESVDVQTDCGCIMPLALSVACRVWPNF